jgi:hypothetical protein
LDSTDELPIFRHQKVFILLQDVATRSHALLLPLLPHHLLLLPLLLLQLQ